MGGVALKDKFDKRVEGLRLHKSGSLVLCTGGTWATLHTIGSAVAGGRSKHG